MYVRIFTLINGLLVQLVYCITLSHVSCLALIFVNGHVIYWLTQYWGFCSETGQIWSEIGQTWIWSDLVISDQTTWPKIWNLAGKLSDLILSGFWLDLTNSDQISRVTAKTSQILWQTRNTGPSCDTALNSLLLKIGCGEKTLQDNSKL